MARKPLIAPGSILPVAESPTPPPADDLLSRIVANDRAKRHQAYAEAAPSQALSNTTGNTTVHTSSQPAENISDNIDGNQNKNILINTTSNTTKIHETRAIIAQEPEIKALSLAEQIRRNARSARSTRPAPLRMITLKVPPDLDDRVEAHCQQSGRKKQEVIRDALRLYLEIVEQAEEEGAES